jgi:DNA repair protein RadC
MYISRVEVSVIADVKENTEKFGSAKEAYNSEIVKKELLRADREKFICIHLNTRNRVLSYEVVSVGSLGASIVEPREVFKAAILANARSIIIMHNHPSGDPNPSEEDIAITERLVKAGRILGISVLDHIIIGNKNFYSLSENGLI